MRAGRLAMLAAAALALGAAAPAPPRRVVSLNPCLDSILLSVADPGQIAALSHWSRDPAQSAAADQARPYPVTWGSAEEVLAAHADLVLMSGMGGAISGVLPQLHIASARFKVPASVAESEAQVSRIAALVGHPERGRAVNARIERALAEAAPPPGARPLTALIYEGRGFASGPGTLMDALMTRAGFQNQMRRYGFKRSADVPLERVVADPPQVLLAGSLAPGQPTWADRVLSHPALSGVRGRMARERFPAPLLYCGGPVIVPAMQALAAARRDAVRELMR